jgi:hypothetical protein
MKFGIEGPGSRNSKKIEKKFNFQNLQKVFRPSQRAVLKPILRNEGYHFCTPYSRVDSIYLLIEFKSWILLVVGLRRSWRGNRFAAHTWFNSQARQSNTRTCLQARKHHAFHTRALLELESGSAFDTQFALLDSPILRHCLVNIKHSSISFFSAQ